MYNHMNNSIYSFLYVHVLGAHRRKHLIYSSFDSIVNAYLIEHCGLHPPSSNQIGLVVHSHCDYFGSVAYPGVVHLGMRVSALGKSSATYEIGIFEQNSEDVKAVGGFTHVFVERSNNRPSANGMSAEIRVGLAKLITQKTSKL